MANKIVITGRCPSKKNSRRPFIRGGRIMNFPSKDYVAWHKVASKELTGSKKIESDFLVIKFWFPDNRRTDLSNKAESIMDLLVDNGLLQDDCWQVIRSLTLQSEGVDKTNPRVIIEW
jgi:hypothetical protein